MTRLRHMLSHAKDALELARGRTRDDLDRDRSFSRELLFELIFVGEAASQVSEDVRSKHAEIPWSRVVGLRNRLVHGYDSVDFGIVWKIVTQDTPALVAAREEIVRLEDQHQ